MEHPLRKRWKSRCDRAKKRTSNSIIDHMSKMFGRLAVFSMILGTRSDRFSHICWNWKEKKKANSLIDLPLWDRTLELNGPIYHRSPFSFFSFSSPLSHIIERSPNSRVWPVISVLEWPCLTRQFVVLCSPLFFIFLIFWPAHVCLAGQVGRRFCSHRIQTWPCDYVIPTRIQTDWWLVISLHDDVRDCVSVSVLKVTSSSSWRYLDGVGRLSSWSRPMAVDVPRENGRSLQLKTHPPGRLGPAEKGAGSPMSKSRQGRRKKHKVSAFGRKDVRRRLESDTGTSRPTSTWWNAPSNR